MKKLLHIVEFIIVKTAFAIFAALSFQTASNLGGKIGRFIGLRLGVTRTARRNIKMAMPDLSDAKIEEIITQMWDHLGRVITELPHVAKLSAQQMEEIITIEGAENLETIKNSQSCILFTGHIGNWEFLPKIYHHNQCPLHIVYRKANNPYVDKIIYDLRAKTQSLASAKGSVGARQIIKSLKNNGKVIMLVDQKQNDGIAVPFFGRPAMTAPAIATMALKYNVDIIPTRIVRLKNNKFKLQIFPALKIEKTSDEQQDTLTIMTQINSILEDWIRQTPEQWFWVHNRWPKKESMRRRV